jgi:hypothetical protein
LCQIIGVARSSFYYWQTTTPDRAARDAADVALATTIRQVHAASDGAYGAQGHRRTARQRPERQP